MSDTKQELLRDEWHMNHLEECGTCKFMIRRKGINYCNNPDSEMCGINVDYDDGCGKYREGKA